MKNKNIVSTCGLALLVLVLATFALTLSGCGPSPSGSASSSSPAAAAPALPNDFQIDERVLSFTTTFDVVAGGKSYGTVSEHILSLTRTLSYHDANGMPVATGRVALVSWGTEINVYDANGRRVGTIKERVIESLWKTWTTYSILDASGSLVAESEKVEILATTITLKDSSGSAVAVIRRPMINFTGDTWEISVKQPGVVDSRLLVLIGAFKTAADNSK